MVVELTYSARAADADFFASNNGGSPGGGVYFNSRRHTYEGVRIDGLGLSSGQPAWQPLRRRRLRPPGTAFGFEQSSAGWRQVVAAAPASPTASTSPPAPPSRRSFLPRGTWGFAVSMTGALAWGQR